MTLWPLLWDGIMSPNNEHAIESRRPDQKKEKKERSLKYISFKKFRFGQKRPCVLRNFVPRGVFYNPGGWGGGVVKKMVNQTVILIFARYRTYLLICCAIFSKGK